MEEQEKSTIVRGTVDMDDYVPLENLGEENTNNNNNVFGDGVIEETPVDINSINAPLNLETPNVNQPSQINFGETPSFDSNEGNHEFSRNGIELGLVDLQSTGEEEVKTQDELDENINGETKYNEAGKKEIRVEIDPVVTNVHKKDDKIKKMISFGFIAIIIIVAILIFGKSKNNNSEAFSMNIKAAADKYINDSLNSSLLSSLYLEKKEEVTISVLELYNRGYYDGKLVDPKTKEDVSDKLVKIYIKEGNLEFEYPYENNK